MTNVFYVVLWTDSPAGSAFTVAGNGASFVSRGDADRVASTYRALLIKGYASNGTLEEAYHSRVGVLEMSPPDARLGHPTPTTTKHVDKLIAAMDPPCD